MRLMSCGEGQAEIRCAGLTVQTWSPYLSYLILIRSSSDFSTWQLTNV